MQISSARVVKQRLFHLVEDFTKLLEHREVCVTFCVGEQVINEVRASRQQLRIVLYAVPDLFQRRAVLIVNRDEIALSQKRVRL